MAQKLNFIELGADRYQPDSAFTYANNRDYELDQRNLAFFVGVVALGMPVVMWAGTRLGVCFYDSISHFYYAQFLGGIFIAMLVFIGTFMLAYRGQNPSENLLATLAGFCALAVALFPTSGRGCEVEQFSGRALADFVLADTAEFVTVVPASPGNTYFELFKGADILHFVSAALLFAFLAYYSFCVFTRVIDEKHCQNGGTLKPQKRKRNRIYRVSGALILLSILAILINAVADFAWWNPNNVTFWFETLALWAFGFSWMVKGRFFGMALLDEDEMQKNDQ